MAALKEIDVKKFLKDLQIDCTSDIRKLNKFEYYLKHNYISLKEDHDGLSKCILKFIELIINYVSSKEDYQDQVLISKKYFGVIKDCTSDIRKLNKFEYYLKHNYILLKEDHDGLSKCILKFIELIINYVSSKEDYQDQVLISKKYFGVIKDIIQDDLKNFFMEKFTKLIFDTLIEDDSKKTWCVKKELLKVFNCCIQNSNKAVKYEVVSQLPPIYLCKMVDNISSYGDYDLQVTVIETIFRMYGKSKITPRLRELIPESEELSESFAQINPDHFDDDCRSFLNMLNGKYEKIFSIVCEHIEIDGRCCIPATDYVGGIWVDFNLWDSALSWYQRSSSDKDDDSWELVSLFASNVEAVSTYSKPKEDNVIIKFTVNGGCLTSVEEKQDELDKTKCVNIVVKKSDKADKLICDVLPKILGNRYESPLKSTVRASTGITSYKPLSIKLTKKPKSVISLATTDGSGTMINPVSLASSITGQSEERSVSGESQGDEHPINTTDDIENLSEAAEKNCDEIAKTSTLEILSGRCSDSFVNYRQFNRSQTSDASSQQENYFSQKSVTQNVIPVQSGRTLEKSKPHPNSSSENWHTAEDGIVTYPNRDRTAEKSNAAVLKFSNKLNYTPEMTEDLDSLMVNIHQDDSSQKENQYSNCKASTMKMLKSRKTDKENLTSVTDVQKIPKTSRFIDKKITTNKTTTYVSRNIEPVVNFEEQIILTNDVIPATQNLSQESHSQYFSQSSQNLSIAEVSGFINSFADKPSREMENTDFFPESLEGSPQEFRNKSPIKGKHHDVTPTANSATKELQTNRNNIKASKFSMEPKTVSNKKPSGYLKKTKTVTNIEASGANVATKEIQTNANNIKASKFSMEPKTVSNIKPSGFLKETKTVTNIKASGANVATKEIQKNANNIKASKFSMEPKTVSNIKPSEFLKETKTVTNIEASGANVATKEIQTNANNIKASKFSMEPKTVSNIKPSEFLKETKTVTNIEASGANVATKEIQTNANNIKASKFSMEPKTVSNIKPSEFLKETKTVTNIEASGANVATKEIQTNANNIKASKFSMEPKTVSNIKPSEFLKETKTVTNIEASGANVATKEIQTNANNIKASKFSMEPKTVSNKKPSEFLKETKTATNIKASEANSATKEIQTNTNNIKASKFSMEPKTVSNTKPSGFLKETKTVTNIKASGVLKETMKTSNVPKASKAKDKVKETIEEVSRNEKGISAADDATKDKDKITKLDYPSKQQCKGKQRRQKQIKKLPKDKSRVNEVLPDEGTREEYVEIQAKNIKKRKADRNVKSVEKIEQLELVSEFSKAEPETHHERISLLEGAEVPRIVKTTKVDTHFNKNEVIRPENITEKIDVEINISQEDEKIYKAHTNIDKADLEHFVVTASDVDGTKKTNKKETKRQKNTTDETTSSKRYRRRKATKGNEIIDLDALENKNDAKLTDKNAKKKQTKQILEETDELVKPEEVKRRLNCKMATRGRTSLEIIELSSDNGFNEEIGIDLEQELNKSGVSKEIIGGKPASITSDADVEEVWAEIESNEIDEVEDKEHDKTLKVCYPQHSYSPERNEIANTLHKTLNENPITIWELSDSQDQTSPKKNTIDKENKEILLKGIEADKIYMKENEVQKSYTVQELREEPTSTSSEGDQIANGPPPNSEKESAIEITDNRIECNKDSSEDEIEITNLKRYSSKSKIFRPFVTTSSSEEEPDRNATVAEVDVNREKFEIVDPEKAFELLKKTPDAIRESKEIKNARELVICLNNEDYKGHAASYLPDDSNTIHLSQLSEGQIPNVIARNRNFGFELNETVDENVIINAVKTDEIIKENIENDVILIENVTEVAVTKTVDKTKRSIKSNSKSKENEEPLKKSLKRKATKADSGKNTKIETDKNKLTNNRIREVVKKNARPKKYTGSKIRDVKIEEGTELRRAGINTKVVDESSHEILSEKVPLKTTLKAKIRNVESREKTEIEKTKGQVISENVPSKKYKEDKISDVKLEEKTVNNSDIVDEVLNKKLSLKAPQNCKIRDIESIEKTKIDKINIDTEEIELISDDIDEVANGKKKTVQFELNKIESNSNSIVEQTKDLNQTFSTTVSSRRRRRKLYCPDDMSVIQYAPEENALVDSARESRKTVELQEADKMLELEESSKHDESIVTKRNVSQTPQPKSSVDGKLVKPTTVLDENNNSGKTKTSKSPAYKKVDSRKGKKYTVRYDDMIKAEELCKKKTQRYVKLNKTTTGSGSNGNRDIPFNDFLGRMLNSFRQDLNNGESLLNTLNNYKEKTPTKKRISEKNSKVTIEKSANTTRNVAEKRIHIISDIHLDHCWNKVPAPAKKPRLELNQKAEENSVNGFEGHFLKETAENNKFNFEQAGIKDGYNALIGKPAPRWTATAVLGDEFATIDSDDFIGQFLVLFFYPFDFGKLPYAHPPTEIVDFNENLEQFQQLDANIVCCSVDSIFTHQELIAKWRANESLGQLKIPLISDASHKICKAYQMLVKNSGYSYRGAFIINPNGSVVGYIIMDLDVPITINHIIEYIKIYKEKHNC